MTVDWKMAILTCDPEEFLEMRRRRGVVQGVEDGAADPLEAAALEDLDLRPLMSPDLRGSAIHHRSHGSSSSL